MTIKIDFTSCCVSGAFM